jgi:hypothetical protein
MPMKRYKPEQIVASLGQIEVEIANGKPTPRAFRHGRSNQKPRTSKTEGRGTPSSES